MTIKGKWKLFAVHYHLAEFEGRAEAIFDELISSDEPGAVLSKYAAEVWYPFEGADVSEVAESIYYMARDLQKLEKEK